MFIIGAVKTSTPYLKKRKILGEIISDELFNIEYKQNLFFFFRDKEYDEMKLNLKTGEEKLETIARELKKEKEKSAKKVAKEMSDVRFFFCSIFFSLL